MLGKSRVFDTCIENGAWEEHGPQSATGQLLRSEAAHQILHAMKKCEAEFHIRDESIRRIDDRITRYVAAQRLHADFLFTFGVQYRDVQFLRDLVELTISQNHLTPLQIEILAKDRGVLREYI